MYERAYAVATGIFIVLAAAALALTAYWLAGTDPDRRPYVVVSPYSVAGLSVGSEVLYRGVPAGRVEEIRIDPENPARVLIRIAVDPQVPVFEDTFARLHQRGLTGVAQIELAHDESTQPLETMAADPARIPMAPGLIQQATDLGTQTLEILNSVAETVDEVLSQASGTELRSLATRLDALLLSAERIAGSLEAELPSAIERTTRAADSVADLAQRTTESMDDVDALIAELRATAAVAREVGEDLAASGTPALDRVLLAMRDTAEELGELARSLAANPSQLLRGRQTSPGPGEEQ